MPLPTSSSKIRESLDHPVIDADGHTVEYEPAVREILTEVAGADVAARYRTGPGMFNWYRMSPDERRDRRVVRPPWWGIPAANTLDRATAMIPRLAYDRLDETGVDFSVVYPTQGLFAMSLGDDELRQALCRAYNTYYREVFGQFADRLCPVAVIPMHTPEEAIAELDHAVGEHGMKAVLMPGHVRRAIPQVAQEAPGAARYATWLDNLAVDSDHDYDPVWERCVELGVAPAFHSGGMGWGSRMSVNNYMYNHIGHFAAACEAVCKAMLMGGVTRRFPGLRCAFLEGGVGWASNLYNDLIGHFEKRNGRDVHHYDPKRMDTALLASLLVEHGGERIARDPEAVASWVDELGIDHEPPDMVDEWTPLGITSAEELRDLFVPNFFFGCEADDAMNALAFDERINGFGTKLNAIFSSDVGHWDVPDITEVLEEAYELVEHGLIDGADFRAFTFGNATRLYGDMNPSFFEGTVVADACRAELAQPAATAAG